MSHDSRGPFGVAYCALCKCIAVLCPHCKNSSCNGGGCDLCLDAFRNEDRYTKCGYMPDTIPVIGQGLHKTLIEFKKEDGL